MRDRFAEVGFGILLKFGEDHGADFGRRVFFAAHVDADIAIGGGGHFVGHKLEGALHFGVAEFAAHEAFDGEDGVLGVGDGLPPGDLPHEAFAVFGVDGDDGGDEP